MRISKLQNAAILAAELRLVRALSALGIALLCTALTAQHGSWEQSTSASAWVPRSGHASAVFNNRMWVLGGKAQTNDQPHGSDVWSSADGGTWTQEVSDAPWFRRVGHCVVVFNNRIWLLGGGQVGYWKNDVWSSTDGIIWNLETGAAPWAARHGHECVVFDGRIWLMGGKDTSYAERNDVWSSADGVNWTQETSAAAWQPRMDFVAVAFSNRLWIIGGHRDDVWSSQDGTNWTLELSAAPWMVRWAHAAVVFDGRIWIAGGSFSDPASHARMDGAGDVWSSDDGVSWQQMTSAAAWPDRRFHTMLVFDNRMWIIGGDSNNDKEIHLGDVWSTSTGIGGGYPMQVTMNGADHLFTHNQKLLSSGLTLTCRGGIAPFSWSLTGSNLPSALVFGSSTTNQLEISYNGGDIKTGTYAFSVQTDDGAGESVSHQFTVVVMPMSSQSPPFDDPTPGQKLAAGLAIAYFENGGCSAEALSRAPLSTLVCIALILAAVRLTRRTRFALSRSIAICHSQSGSAEPASAMLKNSLR